MVATAPDATLILPTDASNTGKQIDEFTYVQPGGQQVYQQRIAQGQNSWILSAASVTANGSALIRGVDERELTLIVNIKTTPTGTSPTLTFTMQDVDPVDESTVFGQAVTTAALNATGITTLRHRPQGPTVLVSWTIGGTASPTFPSVNGSISSKAGDDTAPLSVNKKTAVTAATSSTTLLAANSARKKFSIVNDSSGNLRVDQSGGTASATSYTDLLVPGAELIVDTKVPGGLITGIWDITGGNGAIPTEYV